MSSLKKDTGVKTASEAVFKELRKAIISGRLKPGQRLVERDLAADLKVSRTPIREALRKLELQNLVTTVPYKGVIVRFLTYEEAEEIFQVRAKLEGLAAYLAASKVTPRLIDELEEQLELSRVAAEKHDLEQLVYINNDFHRLIAEAGHNQYLLNMLEDLQSAINLLRVSSWSLPARPSQTVREHAAMFNAIKEGKPELAEEKAIEHIKQAWATASQVLKLQSLNPEGRG